MFNKLKKFLKSKRAVGSVATAIKVGTACVLGAAVLVGGVALINDVVLPNTSDKVNNVAEYEGDGVGGCSTGGVTPVNVNTEPVYDGTDLTGTTWCFDDLRYGGPPSTVSLNFVSNSISFTEISNGPGVRVFYDTTEVFHMGWQGDEYRTVSVTGGSDATNPDIIAWFEEYATIIE